MSDEQNGLPTAAIRGWYLSPGLKRIAAERDRQVHAEGFDFAHDDAHDDEALAWAAACYAAPWEIFVRGDTAGEFLEAWPESWEGWDKRDLHDRVRQLENEGDAVVGVQGSAG